MGSDEEEIFPESQNISATPELEATHEGVGLSTQHGSPVPRWGWQGAQLVNVFIVTCCLVWLGFF